MGFDLGISLLSFSQSIGFKQQDLSIYRDIQTLELLAALVVVCLRKKFNFELKNTPTMYYIGWYLGEIFCKYTPSRTHPILKCFFTHFLLTAADYDLSLIPLIVRQDGSRLLVDVTSLSYDSLTKDLAVLDKKLTTIDREGSKTKVLLYNYHHNSPAFFNAPKLDSRIITVSNTDVQQLFSLHNINVDFLKPVETSLRLFSFGDAEVVIKYPTLPREDAIKTIQFTKK